MIQRNDSSYLGDYSDCDSAVTGLGDPLARKREQKRSYTYRVSSSAVDGVYVKIPIVEEGQIWESGDDDSDRRHRMPASA